MSHFGVRDLDGRTERREGVRTQGRGSPARERAGILKNKVLFWGK